MRPHFTLAIFLAWAFDITPEGIIAADAEQSLPDRRFEFTELGAIDITQLDL